VTCDAVKASWNLQSELLVLAKRDLVLDLVSPLSSPHNPLSRLAPSLSAQHLHTPSFCSSRCPPTSTATARRLPISFNSLGVSPPSRNAGAKGVDQEDQGERAKTRAEQSTL
jgi:hypothetical protein